MAAFSGGFGSRSGRGGKTRESVRDNTSESRSRKQKKTKAKVSAKAISPTGKTTRDVTPSAAKAAAKVKEIEKARKAAGIGVAGLKGAYRRSQARIPLAMKVALGAIPGGTAMQGLATLEEYSASTGGYRTTAAPTGGVKSGKGRKGSGDRTIAPINNAAAEANRSSLLTGPDGEVGRPTQEEQDKATLGRRSRARGRVSGLR